MGPKPHPGRKGQVQLPSDISSDQSTDKTENHGGQTPQSPSPGNTGTYGPGDKSYQKQKQERKNIHMRFILIQRKYLIPTRKREALMFKEKLSSVTPKFRSVMMVFPSVFL